jgi:predicted metal-dependent hydrolase
LELLTNPNPPFSKPTKIKIPDNKMLQNQLQIITQKNQLTIKPNPSIKTSTPKNHSIKINPDNLLIEIPPNLSITAKENLSTETTESLLTAMTKNPSIESLLIKMTKNLMKENHSIEMTKNHSTEMKENPLIETKENLSREMIESLLKEMIENLSTEMIESHSKKTIETTDNLSNLKDPLKKIINRKVSQKISSIKKNN